MIGKSYDLQLDSCCLKGEERGGGEGEKKMYEKEEGWRMASAPNQTWTQMQNPNKPMYTSLVECSSVFKQNTIVFFTWEIVQKWRFVSLFFHFISLLLLLLLLQLQFNFLFVPFICDRSMCVRCMPSIILLYDNVNAYWYCFLKIKAGKKQAGVEKREREWFTKNYEKIVVVIEATHRTLILNIWEKLAEKSLIRTHTHTCR